MAEPALMRSRQCVGREEPPGLGSRVPEGMRHPAWNPDERASLCMNPLVSVCTLPAKDRLSLLRVLQGGADPVFRLNELALTLLKELGVAERWSKKLKFLLAHEQDWKESELDGLLDQHLPKLGPKPRKLIKDAFDRRLPKPDSLAGDRTVDL